MKTAFVLWTALLMPIAGSGQTLPQPVPCPGCWQPAPDARWQYQLQGKPAHAATGGINVAISGRPPGSSTAVTPDVFDIDLFEQGATPNVLAVTAIHQIGAHAVCYVSAGSWENWRPDAAAFPAAVLGRSNGWPGERWLDIRRLDVLGPLMAARAQLCQDAGFDAIEWDNVDGHANRTGFPLTPADQLAYNVFLANLAHTHGLSVGLKNDLDQVAALEPWFDFAVNEQCHQYRECGLLAPFTAAGKAAFVVEYKKAPARFCPQANSSGLAAIHKKLALGDTPWTPCQ